MSELSTIAVLGAGALGAAMATRLGHTGHQVRLWNRTADKARVAAAGAPGVRAADTVAEAVTGAAVVFTVLRDGEAVTEVMSSAVESLAEHAVWVQASTVGPDSARALADLAAAHRVAYLDAPVSGSTGPALNGTLVWLVSGAADVVDRARPVLADLGSTVLHVGTGTQGSALKLVVNAWMTAATVAMSDVLALCDDVGIEHDTLVRALAAGPLAMPYELQKVDLMTSGSYPAGFAVR
ncbi:MAG TPA: NAD(P)-binding domain-containing protein, partial [Pseudonocardiaceae bacterium]|nr:NAD(P)-binding domain-containing protein [Pseudonocardiaceae bacterium]